MKCEDIVKTIAVVALAEVASIVLFRGMTTLIISSTITGIAIAALALNKIYKAFQKQPLPLGSRVIQFHNINDFPQTFHFSNFYECYLTYENQTYKCTEAIYQKIKLTKYLKKGTPQYIKDQIEQFDFNHSTGQEVWEFANQFKQYIDTGRFNSDNRELMKDIVRAKFQMPRLKQILLDTQDAYLVERSNSDSYWGDGSDNKGKNELGKILMEIREELGGPGLVSDPRKFSSIDSTSREVQDVAKKCKYPGCSKDVHPGYDFCSRSHGRAYAAL